MPIHLKHVQILKRENKAKMAEMATPRKLSDQFRASFRRAIPITLGQNSKMAISINTFGLSGSILLWLGVTICLGGLALFLAVYGGISPDADAKSLHSHDTYYILIHGMRRLIFLLPIVAGLILVVSGLLVRRQIPALESSLINATEHIEDKEL